LPANNLGRREKDKGLESAIGAIYQTFGGRDLYPTMEEKASHLLYFAIEERQDRRLMKTSSGGGVGLQSASGCLGAGGG